MKQQVFPMRNSSVGNNNACSFVTLTFDGCKIYSAHSSGNKCKECQDDYFLDSTTEKCVLRSKHYGLENCFSTTTDNIPKNVCGVCKEPYYKDSNNKCVEMEGCLKTSTDGTCNMCKDNFYLEFETNLCQPIPAESDCCPNLQL